MIIDADGHLFETARLLTPIRNSFPREARLKP